VTASVGSTTEHTSNTADTATGLLHWTMSFTYEKQGSYTSGEYWKNSGNLSCQGKVRGTYFFGKVWEKSGKMKNWCHQMSDF